MKKFDDVVKSVKKWVKITATAVVVIFIILVISAILRNKALNDKYSDVLNLEYEGNIAVELNDNKPVFSKDELKKAKNSYESYSKLDSLGRCGVVEASVSTDTMPMIDEKRTSLGSVNPSGWQRLNFWVRCHLIGWQLTAENDNERNLITGTSRMNMSGMLPYENIVAKYIEENPTCHVLYRVTPCFDGNDLVAKGVIMQAESVEDKGEGVSFNVFVFNYQPGSIIDYKTGMVEDNPDYQTTITIADKTVRYNGDPIKIDSATVIGSTGTVKYIYYTDEDAKVKTTEATGAESSGGPPSERGEYYVRAIVSADEWYSNAASNVARLIIN